MAVDISTPPEVFETVRTQLAEFFKANAGEYSGNFLCVANFAGDPLKYTLVRIQQLVMLFSNSFIYLTPSSRPAS